MAKIVCRKIGRALVPVDDDAIAFVDKLPEGRDLMVEAKRVRNIRHFRLYWGGIVKVVLENSPLFELASKEDVSDAIKMATGHARKLVDAMTGRVFYKLESIKVEAMGQDEWKEFFDLAIRVITERWFPPGTDCEDVRRQIFAKVDGPHAIGERAA